MFPLALTTFIQNNPGFAAWLIGGLFVVIGALIAGFWAVLATRLSHLEQGSEHLEERVSLLEETLAKYEVHVGAGDKMLDRLESGIAQLSTQLAGIHQDNMAAHSLINERLAKVENKMPNGQLAELIKTVTRIAGKVGA